MAFVNGVYQPNDQRSPLERLYGFEETQAKRQALQRQQAMQQQREQILREAYQPAEEARTEYAFDESQAPQQGGLSNIMGALGIADAPQMQTKQVEAKPEQFNRDTAINRMYSIGDFEGAKSLVDNEYKGAMAGRASGSGAEKWYGNSKTIKGADGKLYNQLLSSAGNVKLVPVDGDMTGELKQMDIGGKKVWVNSYTGEPVREFDVTATDYQQFQMSPGAQADMEYVKGEAGERGKAAGQRSSEKLAKGEDSADAITELNSMVASLEVLPKSVAGMRAQDLAAYFTGGDPATQEALGNIDRISGKMLKYADKLPGAASESDKIDFKAGAGVMSDPNATPARKIAAARTAIAAFQRMQAAGDSAPASRPAPGRPPVAQSQAMPSLPNPAQHKGRIARDQKTGLRYQSNGSQWMRVK